MVEIVRMVADWLSGTQLDALGASQSVAVHLTALSYDGSDTAPTTPTVVDESRDDSAARGDYPATLPALVVSLQELTLETAPLTQTVQDGACVILVRYIGQHVDSSNALRDGAYVMRAVRRSLERFHLAQEADAARTRNNMVLIPSPEPMRFLKVAAAREDEDVFTGWLVPYGVRDLNI